MRFTCRRVIAVLSLCFAVLLVDSVINVGRRMRHRSDFRYQSSVDFIEGLDWNGFELGRSKRFWATWWETFFVNEQYKILFCVNRKAASSNIVRYIAKLTLAGASASDEAVNALDTLPIYPTLNNNSLLVRHLSSYRTKHAIRVMRTYAKVLWVRNPLDRFLSGWNDWLYATPARDQSRLKKRRQLRQKMQQLNIQVERSDTISLREFLVYLAKSPDPSDVILDHHWMPMAQECKVAYVHYDFIGHVESMEADWQAVVGKWTDLTRMPRLPPKQNHSFELDRLSPRQHARLVGRQLLEHVMNKFYSLDYRLFGYELKKDLDDLYR